MKKERKKPAKTIEEINKNWLTYKPKGASKNHPWRSRNNDPIQYGKLVNKI